MEIRMNWEQLLSTETQVKREVEPEDFAKYPMDDLEKDYKAIISSAAFRRLQDKTQVFPLDKSDFVRTRIDTFFGGFNHCQTIGNYDYPKCDRLFAR